MFLYLLFGLVSVWLATCAWVDWRTGRVPNALTIPVIALGAPMASVRAFMDNDPAVPVVLILLWALFYTGWLMNWYGGGDAKLRMALAAIWPTPGLLIALLLSAVFAGALVLALDYRKTYPRMRAAAQRTTVGLVSGQWGLLRSDQDELHRLGRRGTWEIALGGIGYAAYALLLASPF